MIPRALPVVKPNVFGSGDSKTTVSQRPTPGQYISGTATNNERFRHVDDVIHVQWRQQVAETPAAMNVPARLASTIRRGQENCDMFCRAS